MQGHPDDWAAVLEEYERLMTPKKITDYIVVASNCKSTLSKRISEWSQAGYCIYYGPFTNKESDQHAQEICQAMVKYG